ncbi:MAG TPA: tetratricopeptide repeat protein [Phycisphaerae bacterium]|nr:tetratricopeptide repeat protein [Phycisphaerae bacterium]HRW53405.1 tetratricopeptide repeat protein [Phycisphaerae bacterium]
MAIHPGIFFVTETAPSTSKGQPSRRRTWAFRLIAVLLALSPFLIGETICRFAGYGGYPPVLKRMKMFEGVQYVGTYQPGLNTFFWQNLSSTGGMEEHVFVTPKPKGRLRIMTFGGSAMRGFPEPRPFVSTSFLSAMLRDVWPDRDFEVLNFGTTAVASFPVMYILDEALAFEPDLVVIYSGNNEFYGAGGVASLHAFGQSTLSMKTARAFRATGLGQWISDVRTRKAAEAESTSEEGGRAKSLMESVIADGQLVASDGRRRSAINNLTNHLTSMIGACRAHDVPVIVCTLPANERDMAPLGRDIAPAEGVKAIESQIAEAEATLEGDPATAEKTLASILATNPDHARAHYLLGRCCTALRRDADALTHYERALELDPMPWRAPGSLSAAVRDVARSNDVILCDLVEAFRRESPGGAIGWELMDDHVHPTMRGQAVIARSLLRSMTSLNGSLKVESSAIDALPSWEAYAKALGDNVYDRYGVQHRMLTLFEAPFYAESNPAALARARRLCADYRAGFDDSVLKAIDYWLKPETHRGGFRPITGFVGAVLMSEGKFQEAASVLDVARRSVAEYSLWNLQLTWRELMARRQLQSTPSAEDVAIARGMIEDGETMYRATGIRNAELCRYLGLVYHYLGDHRNAVSDLNVALEPVVDMSGFDVVQALVDSLIRTGQRERALRILRSPVRDPQLAEACRRLLAPLETPAAP